MRKVSTVLPSFPNSPNNELLPFIPDERWQVLCGDEAHWRLGIYSPGESCHEDIRELEWHDCPELFLLLSGRLSLWIAKDGVLQDLELQPNQPVLITAPHCGFCPDGPHRGTALVVERDRFETIYRTPQEWVSQPEGEEGQGQ